MKINRVLTLRNLTYYPAEGEVSIRDLYRRRLSNLFITNGITSLRNNYWMAVL